MTDIELHSQIITEYPVPCACCRAARTVRVEADDIGWIVYCEECLWRDGVDARIGTHHRSPNGAIGDWNQKQLAGNLRKI